MDFGSTFLELLILFILILINAFFAMSEIALITINDNKIKHMANRGNKRASKIVKLIENSSNFLATIQVGVTLSGFLTSAVASQSFVNGVVEYLSFLPFSPSIISAVATFIVTLILSYFSLVLGELVPKKIAMQKAESISFKVVGILRTVAFIFSPFIKFLSASTNLVVKFLGFDPNASEETVTEEEIMMMVDVGKEKGVIEDSAKHMISNIFDFDNTTVTEVMTHRTDVFALEDIQTVADAVDISIKYGYSRIPVFKEDLDNIVGIVHVKDLLKYVCTEVPKDTKLTDIMRPATFIPESKKCDELFAEDEFYKESDTSFIVDGISAVDEVSDLIGMKIPDGNYETISGMMIEQIGYIPKENEHPSITIGDFTFSVKSVCDKRISKVYIKKNTEKEKTDTNSLNSGKK